MEKVWITHIRNDSGDDYYWAHKSAPNTDNLIRELLNNEFYNVTDELFEEYKDCFSVHCRQVDIKE